MPDAFYDVEVALIARFGQNIVLIDGARFVLFCSQKKKNRRMLGPSIGLHFH